MIEYSESSDTCVGGTVVMRSDNEEDLEPYRRSIEMFGAKTEIVDQKTIGGAKVF